MGGCGLVPVLCWVGVVSIIMVGHVEEVGGKVWVGLASS